MNTNLLDLNNDVLNIIGDYVKKDILEEKIKITKKLMNEEQIINGKKIRFTIFSWWIPFSFIIDENDNNIQDKNNIPKDNIKSYIFAYIADEICRIKKYASEDKTNLKSIDIRMCIWVFFQRCKIVLKMHQIYLNMEDEKKYFDEYLTLKKIKFEKQEIFI